MAKYLELTGVLHGKTITLDEATFLPDGCPVIVHLSLSREEALRQLTLPGPDLTEEELAELEEVLSEMRGPPREAASAGEAMSYLLDSDTCTSIIRDVPAATNRFAQNIAAAHVSVVSIAELEMWLLRPRTSLRHRPKFFNFQQAVILLDVTEPVAHRAAMIHSGLRRQGQRIGLGDALIAATALEYSLTLVTRKIPQFINVAGLTVIDWSVS